MHIRTEKRRASEYTTEAIAIKENDRIEEQVHHLRRDEEKA